MTIQLTTPAHLRASQHTATHVIAFLGTGRMGAPMAPNLARAGFEVPRILAAGARAALTNDRPVADERQELQETSLTVIDGFRVPAREG